MNKLTFFILTALLLPPLATLHAAEPPARKQISSSGLTSGSEAATFTPPRFAPPANAVVIAPGTEIQSAVDQHPAGKAFLLKAGMHRLQSVTPKNGMSFYGEVDKDGRLLTTINGANLITNFEREGKLWVITGQTQKGSRTAYAQEKKGIWRGTARWMSWPDGKGPPIAKMSSSTTGICVMWACRPAVPMGRPWHEGKADGGEASKAEKQKTQFDFTKGKGKAEDVDDGGSAVLFVDRAGKTAGIKSEFFDFNESLTKIPDLSGRKPDFERIDENIGTDYRVNGYVWPGLDDRFADTFASRHTGFLKIRKAGKYTFYLSSDDGSKLWIDGALVIDNDGPQTLR